GGLLVIGIEEEKKDGIGSSLSNGVSRSQLKAEQLQQIICGRIQQSVAGCVSVYPVPVGENPNGEKLFAFVVDVRQGSTAYQADDKKYYARRSGQTVAMEDKDIRLRMLAGDKPRISINLTHQKMLAAAG